MAYFVERLKIACEGTPIHSSRSWAFVSETPQVTIRVLNSVWADRYRVLEIMTS